MELDPDKIINWAINYADYEELQNVAKSVYSIYVMRRKKEYPEDNKAAKKTRKKYRKRGWKNE